MTIQQVIEKQHRIIESTLVPLMKSDYIFIDLPYYSNIGDTLIWKGTETFLSKLPYKCLGKASFQTFQFPKLSEDVAIIMMGGGNWGDLYAPHNQLRREVATRYPNNRIIVLPQTVYYQSARNARNDAKVFHKNKNLIICARDKYSYHFLKAFGFSKNILLLPDMAFCIDTEGLKKMGKHVIGKDLLFQRVDKEKANVAKALSLLKDGMYDISDWPLYEGNDIRLEKLFELIKQGKFTEADLYATTSYMPNRVKEGVELISQYNKVFSNRLHGAILSVLLEKEVFIIDNSYGKNRHYYETWLINTEKINYLPISQPVRPKRALRFIVFWMLTLIDRMRS